MSRFRFVSDNRHAYDVKRLCQVLEVSRSGFYAWTSRPPSTRATRDAQLRELIVEVHQRSRRTYGAPRITPSYAGSASAAPASGSPGSWPPTAWSVCTPDVGGGEDDPTSPPHRTS